MLFRGKTGCFLTTLVLKIQPKIFVLIQLMARGSAFGNFGLVFQC
ncbi:hypothetical protein HMPREF1333_03126 [Enterococcus faecalis ERV37]|uniref:Uncharacterized protein n=1 Tax=Enterococcus faecalis RP2S-4 TaxID=1244145 RepID=A0ABC9TMG3_ENTFL|nr:hypothetical protein HMPREF1333_03126 [Enterococcus faecalis ERV37]EPI11161.1 hypothetical protein D358_00519 [Enterococcus faecalis RP2S-4]EPI40398.1 hypothetical protein D347_00288 [Enterococcus faecalis LA3B-2]KDE18146.1 hypothetical protein HMPREF2097_00649 [Enterococcus faecalis 918]